MIIKKHARQGKLVLAICDSDILGKSFSEGDAVLDLKSEFYKGEKMPEENILKLVRVCYMINAIGKKSTGFLIEKEIISKEDIKEIGGVPYTLVLFC